MNTLAQNTDTQVNQAECTNMSLESRKALERKGIFVRTCEELTRHVKAVALGAVLAAAPVSAQGSNSAPTEQTASLAQTAPTSPEAKQDLSAASRAFMESLVKNGDITPEVLEKVMTSDAFEYNPGKDEAPISREKLALPDANLPLHFAELLKVLGKDPVSSKKWEERIAEMSPNEDELQILRKVIAAMPDDKLQPTVIANTLIGIMTLHKFVQAPDDKYLLLNMYDDIHKVLYGLGWDVSSHVMVPVNDGELSYTFLLPTTVESIVFIGEKAGFDPNKLQAFHKALIPAQQEFIAKAKEFGVKENLIERMKNAEARALEIKKTKGYDMPEYNLLTQWMLAVEQGKIGLQKAQAFRDAYAQLSPEDQKAFVSTIDTKTLLSSGTTPAHVAFNGLKEDQRKEFDELVKPRVKKEADLIKMISQIYASTDRNEDVLAGIEKNSAGVGRFQPVVASLGVSQDAYMIEAFNLDLEAMDWSKLTDAEKEAKRQASLAKTQAETASIAQENASIAQENASIDRNIDRLDENIVKTTKETAKILVSATNGAKID